MPIIGTVGARSVKTRFAYACIFAALGIGALTMLYPLSLMLAGSVKSEADGYLITPWPEFWFDDGVLFQKYAESKHNATLDLCSESWGEPLANWRLAKEPAPVAAEVVADWRAWRATPEALALGTLGHVSGARLLPKNARLFRSAQMERHGGDLAAYRAATGALAPGWASVSPPAERIGRFRNRASAPALLAAFAEFKQTAPREDLFFPNPDWEYGRYLAGLRGDTSPAAAAGVSIRRFAPLAEGPEETERWETFVRTRAPLDCLRLSESAAASAGLPRTLAEDPGLRTKWETFLKSPECRVEDIEVYGPRERFADFRASLGRSPEEVAATPPLGAVAARCDWEDCMAAKKALRREFTSRNYKQVVQYVAMHGNGLRNTAIYCSLAILVSLLVNPLAAYALSRFRMPGTYHVLLFCMATMAFPGEVSMIPSFLLVKRFPLVPLCAAIVALSATFVLLGRVKVRPRGRAVGGPERLPDGFRLLFGILAALAVGGAVGALLGPRRSHVSLLNSFAALVLPGAASGYFIFLLKGFFDSMPRELYEAAEIDGAGEWTKFWHLAMNLSKPILAVIALGAFTGAYGAFMMALVTIPDQRMWTLMVWIFQLQSASHGAVVYASLVLAAIPTFAVFALCQNVIIRGIVVPTEK